MPLTSKVLRGLPVALVLTSMLMLGSVAFAQSAGASAAGAAAPLTLEEGLALAKARACLGCHQVDNKRVGPSFNAIAQRHADKNDAVPYIVQVIQKGGRGQWGAVPMPGQSVNHQDAEKLAQWILSLRK
jgi:cytochrome c